MADRLFELRRRTFAGPHFRGIEFIEVEAKSVINKVPGGGLPFDYTINPYRGCTHACVACLSGETPILMANGRTRSIADLRRGDEVYGTVRDGNYRRLVVTTVLDEWRTRKPAYRVTLDDGTKLVASADHRFLSNRGWKHVSGAEQGPLQRPFLTTNNKLIGLGGFTDPPKHGPEYRRGYLAGMIRGDGHLATYTYSPRPRRKTVETQYRFRLALKDLEALDRTELYLREFGVETGRFVFGRTRSGWSQLHAMRAYSKSAFRAVTDLIAWPDDPSEEWTRGFLAGIFDAEGSYSKGVLRIFNTDDELVGWISSSLFELEFRRMPEVRLPGPGGRKDLRVVRLLGGQSEAMRFFQATDPAITRKRSFIGQRIKNKAALGIRSIDDLNLEISMYDITTGTGDFIANGVISHNCFARPTHEYLDMNAGRDFETKIVVKVNAPEVLRKELASKRWKGDPIAMGTNTDPYQRAEGRYKITRGILEALVEFRNPFSILTRAPLLLRDLDLLKDAARVAEVSTAFSVPTLDEDAWRKTEPGAPHPRKRIEAVRKLNEAGIPCGVMVAPVIPFISDEPRMLVEVVRAAIDAGATHISPILLHLRRGVREEFMGWLRREHPELVASYEEMYSASAYGPKTERNALSKRVGALIRGAGGYRLLSPPRRRRAAVATPKPKQLQLL